MIVHGFKSSGIVPICVVQNCALWTTLLSVVPFYTPMLNLVGLCLSKKFCMIFNLIFVNPFVLFSRAVPF